MKFEWSLIASMECFLIYSENFTSHMYMPIFHLPTTQGKDTSQAELAWVADFIPRMAPIPLA